MRASLIKKSNELPDPTLSTLNALLQGLRELGYMEGENLAIEVKLKRAPVTGPEMSQPGSGRAETTAPEGTFLKADARAHRPGTSPAG
jgi:hypothetical protein